MPLPAASVPAPVPAKLPGDFSSFTGLAENPYLAPYYNQAADQVTGQYQNAIAPGVLASGIASGTLGSTGNVFTDRYAQDTLGQSLASLAAQIYEPAYAQERQLQFGAAQAQNQDALQAQSLADQLQLGMGNLALGGRGQDISRELGLGQLSLGGRQLDLNRELGQGQLQLGGQSLADQLAIAQMGDATQRQGLANNLALGQGQLALGGQNAANNFALGQGQLALGGQTAANNFALGQGQLQLGGQGQNISALSALANAVLGAGQLNLGQQQQDLNSINSIPALLAAQYLPSQALLNSGNQQQGQQQNILDVIYKNAFQKANWPMQNASFLSGLVGNLVGGSGTQVSVGPGPGSGSKL